ncbi:ribonuclease H-like domain-containing protein [Phlyctochytrium arcticum]|nr:ribonuclease H-like domain-containing protein [Phlyctochytrium arcticum]
MQLWQTGGKIIHKGVFRTKDTSIMRILPWDDPKQDQNSFRRSSTLKRARYSPPDHLPKLSYRNGGGYRVAYTKSVRGADAVVELCRDNVLGFDMEWRPQFQRGKKENKTALIQLCSKNIIGLFHVIHMQEFPSALRTILEDPDIKKSGLNIAGDANKLYRDYGVSLAGHLDVGHIAKSIPISMDRCTLQELVHRMLGSYLDKSDRIRMGNWARYSLDAAQREYAATDVYASYKGERGLRWIFGWRSADQPSSILCSIGISGPAEAGRWCQCFIWICQR